MASTPRPSRADTELRPITRATRSLERLRPAVPVAVAARSSVASTATIGVPASLRPEPPEGALPAVELPWGLWTRRSEDDELVGLEPALAQYAARLRARRQRNRPLVRRGIPLVIRRGGDTRLGVDSGPGGLARTSRPVDHVPAPSAPRATVRPTPRPAGGSR